MSAKGHEDGEAYSLPRLYLNLNDLQARYPNSEDISVMGMYDEVVREGAADTVMWFENEDFATLFGRNKVVCQHILEGLAKPAETLATTLFIDTFNREVPASQDIDQLAWRLNAFTDPTAFERRYVGGRFAISGPGAGDPERRKFKDKERLAMASIQVIKFCEAHPELEQAALDVWSDIALDTYFRNYLEVNVAHIDVMDELVEPLKDETLTHEANANRQRLLEAMQDRITWFRELSPEFDNPTIQALIKNLANIPLEQIGMHDLEDLNEALMSPDFDAGMEPGLLMNAALNAVRNYLGGIVKSNSGVSPGLKRVFERIQDRPGGMPLSFADFTGIVDDAFTPALDRVKDTRHLSMRNIGDFSLAIDRLMFVIRANRAKDWAARGETERYRLAANCIKRIALFGAESKLDQTPASEWDITMRYVDSGTSTEELDELLSQFRRQVRQGASFDLAVRRLRNGAKGTRTHHVRRKRFKGG